MATNFFPARGCVYHVEGDDNSLYRLEGLRTGGSGSSVILLTGLDLEVRDIVMSVNTTAGFKVMYVFGEDFGNVRVSGEILLGSEINSGHKVDLVRLWFDKNRVSVKKAPVNFSIGSSAFSVYLHGMLLGSPDTQFQIQPFAFSGTQVSTK